LRNNLQELWNNKFNQYNDAHSTIHSYDIQSWLPQMLPGQCYSWTRRFHIIPEGPRGNQWSFETTWDFSRLFIFRSRTFPSPLNMMFIPLFSLQPNSQVKPSCNLLSVILSFYCPTFPENKLAYYKARRICWEDEPSSRFRCVWCSEPFV